MIEDTETVGTGYSSPSDEETSSFLPADNTSIGYTKTRDGCLPTMLIILGTTASLVVSGIFVLLNY
jgi:hypothetical protein